MNTFFISDTHFGHANILKYEPQHRPFATIEEHDEELVRRWNSVVRPKDTVWHLGDVLFGVEAFDTLGRLNGTKNLILGNHDKYPITKYTNSFKKVRGTTIFAGYWLSHQPLAVSSIERFNGNIHGHMHSKCIDDERYINVSVERINLTPIAFEELRK